MSNDAVLQETTNEIIKSGDITNKIYVDCSTVHPETSAAVSKQITEAGGQFVAGKHYFTFRTNFNIAVKLIIHSPRLWRRCDGRSR